VFDDVPIGLVVVTDILIPVTFVVFMVRAHMRFCVRVRVQVADFGQSQQRNKTGFSTTDDLISRISRSKCKTSCEVDCVSSATSRSDRRNWPPNDSLRNAWFNHVPHSEK
jgi:hypothetical protein